ncbi:MAG TPA: G5 domain-containing protein [Candidatus Saccharimonadales bacterium]|nr:G5 domain-containing protein [Candidatus Saccharimonadales bacterium]
MEVIYHISSALIALLYLGLPIATILLLVKPTLLQKIKRTDKPASRPRILLVSIICFIAATFILGSIAAATEPANVKAERAAKEAASQKAQEAKEEEKKPITKSETKTEIIAFSSNEEKDNTLPKGQTRVKTEGVNGERSTTYEIIYVEGKETSRRQIDTKVTKEPIAKVTQVGTYVAPSAPDPKPAPAPTPPPAQNEEPSTSVYYRNCAAARAAGAAPVYAGQPGYGPHLDRDHDGIGCE